MMLRVPTMPYLRHLPDYTPELVKFHLRYSPFCARATLTVRTPDGGPSMRLQSSVTSSMNMDRIWPKGICSITIYRCIRRHAISIVSIVNELTMNQCLRRNSKTFKSEHDNLVRRFGKDYKKPYGWAASAIGIKSPSFDQIERHIGLDHMRPYYGMASDNVHANSHGALFRIGLGLETTLF